MIRRKTLPEVLFDLMEEMERSLEKRPSWDLIDGCMEPLVYVDESEDRVIITADLPCVEKKDIRINATEDSIELEAKLKTPFKFERWGVLQKKACFGSFKKVITLRSRIEPEKAKAKFRKGILRITIPKIGRKREIKIE